MADGARSDDAGVQAALDRLFAHGPGTDTLGLDRITHLLGRIGNPHRALPPVFHVAGTNGKGSTVAFLRAMLEAAGYAVHAYTSPHLVRFNERIRLAGTLITDHALAPLLTEVLDAGVDLGPSFFEATTAAAFLAFARTPADACIIEVGLGGRLDATNVIERPLVTGIASLGIDHEAFLLAPEDGVPDMPPLERIAFEKAGIAKPGVPLVTQAYPPAVAARIAASAAQHGATLVMRGQHWSSVAIGRGFALSDQRGKLYANPPVLPGAHQTGNAALAIAMLHQQPVLPVSDAAVQRGLATARWPARMQRLAPGPLTAILDDGPDIWLDGGHNPDAGLAIAGVLAGQPPVDVVIGMLANKDARGFLAPFAAHIASLTAVPVPGHAHHEPAALCDLAQGEFGITDAIIADNVTMALGQLARRGSTRVLICGTLYLAGDVLRLNNQVPD